MKLITKTLTSYQDLLNDLQMVTSALPDALVAYHKAKENNAPEALVGQILSTLFKLEGVRKEVSSFLVYFILPTFPNIDAGYDWWMSLAPSFSQSDAAQHQEWMDLCLYEAFN